VKATTHQIIEVGVSDGRPHSEAVDDADTEDEAREIAEMLHAETGLRYEVHRMALRITASAYDRLAVVACETVAVYGEGGAA